MTKGFLKRMIRNSESGFTLLEVIIALAIMTIGFVAILSIQSGAIKGSTRAKQANIVAMLSKNKMIESEFLVEGKAFTDVKEEESGQFEDPYQDFSWKREIKEIEFPEIDFSALSKKEGESSAAENEGGSDAISMVAKIITKFLSKAIREIRITVSWKSGKEVQSFTLTNYWVNLNNEIELTP